jgi:predicted lysophospholipase L1 biosynthesis ABC-type transport system permease subunit
VDVKPDSRPPVLLALVLAAVLVTVLAYGLLPFRAAGAIRCSALLRGSDPRERATTGYLVGQEGRACHNKGSSRLFIGAVAAVVLLVVGVGAVLMPESEMERVMIGGEEELPHYGP